MKTAVRCLAPLGLLMMTLASASSSAIAGSTLPVTKTADTKDGTCDADCSLREAIDAANAQPDANTITLPAGTYALTIPGTAEDANADGDLDITGPIAIAGAGAASTAIDGNGAFTGERVLDGVSGDADLTLSGVTIRGGDETASAGAISMGGDLVLTDVVVGPNHADGSGGATSTGRPQTFTNVVFIGNTAGGSGGVSTTGSMVSGTNVTFVDNHADGSGGVFSSGAPVTLTNATFIGNSAGGHGGVTSSGGTFTVTGGTFSGNSAGGNGGVTSNGGTTTFTNVTLSDNTAGADGGVTSNGGTNTFTNVTMSGNSAVGDGGAMSNGGITMVNNSTITQNTADSDGTGGGDGGGWSGPGLILENSILAGNIDRGGEAPDCDGSVTSGGHTLVGTTAGCTLTGGPGDIVGADPKLGPLADNGGGPATHALLPGSPAIDAGSTLRAEVACAPTDARGVPRDGPCDMGAYELVRCQGTIVNRVGTEGNDRLAGTGSSDGFLAFGGNDRLSGRGGKDRLCAGEGNDRLIGGGGADRLRGEAGRDTLKGGGGNDRHIGGPGRDTCIGGGGGNDRASSCSKERKIP